MRTKLASKHDTKLTCETLKQRALKILAIGVICVSAFTISGCRPFLYLGTFSASYSEHLREAERLTREEKYEEAIQAYEAHIVDRLASTSRPESENPYFYRLIIGDLYLRMKNTPDALKSYELAEKEGVETGLISDRYRLVANWLSEQNRRPEALEVLRKYRDRDPMLFDLMMDRIARELVLLEDASTPTPDPTPKP